MTAIVPQSRQLSIFETTFDTRIRRVEINDLLYFSIYDVFQYDGSEGSAQNPRVYWDRARKQLIKQGAEKVVTQVLQHQFSGQGQRKTPVAPFKVFLRLFNIVEIKEWEAIREWMAELAHERIEEENNPGLALDNAESRVKATYKRLGQSDEWIVDRLDERLTRRKFTDSIKDYVAKGLNFGQITNDMYIGITGYDAQGLREIVGVKSNKTPLDQMSQLAIQYIGIANTVCSIKLKHLAQDELVPPNLAREIIIAVSQQIGIQANQMANSLGIDLVTGVLLLKDN